MVEADVKAGFDGQHKYYGKIRLLDAQGKEVTDSSITRSVNTSKVSITILRRKPYLSACLQQENRRPVMWLRVK